jgi:hypothetical protein
MSIEEQRANLPCPNCQHAVDIHWALGMPLEKLEMWTENENVCTLTQEEVLLLLTL